MKKLSVLILAAAALFAGCNNLTVEKNKDSKSGNVTINIGNQSRTISPMSGVSLDKFEEWTITFEDQNGLIDVDPKTGRGDSFTFTVPAGLYTVTVESTYTPPVPADGGPVATLKLTGTKKDVEIGGYAEVNISVGLKKEETGDFQYRLTGDVSSGFVSLVNMNEGGKSYSAEIQSADIQSEDPSDESPLKAVYYGEASEVVVTGTGLKSGFYKLYVTDTKIIDVDNTGAVIYYDIGDFLVEIADDLTTTGSASSVSESQTQVVYYGTNETTDYNGKFPFARKNVNEILQLLIINKKWQQATIYMNTDVPNLDVVVINLLRDAMTAGNRSVSVIGPEGVPLIALSTKRGDEPGQWISEFSVNQATELSLNANSADENTAVSKKELVIDYVESEKSITKLNLTGGVTVVTSYVDGISDKLTVKLGDYNTYENTAFLVFTDVPEQPAINIDFEREAEGDDAGYVAAQKSVSDGEDGPYTISWYARRACPSGVGVYGDIPEFSITAEADNVAITDGTIPVAAGSTIKFYTSSEELDDSYAYTWYLTGDSATLLSSEPVYTVDPTKDESFPAEGTIACVVSDGKGNWRSAVFEFVLTASQSPIILYNNQTSDTVADSISDFTLGLAAFDMNTTDQTIENFLKDRTIEDALLTTTVRDFCFDGNVNLYAVTVNAKTTTSTIYKYTYSLVEGYSSDKMEPLLNVQSEINAISCDTTNGYLFTVSGDHITVFVPGDQEYAEYPLDGITAYVGTLFSQEEGDTTYNITNIAASNGALYIAMDVTKTVTGATVGTTAQIITRCTYSAPKESDESITPAWDYYVAAGASDVFKEDTSTVALTVNDMMVQNSKLYVLVSQKEGSFDSLTHRGALLTITDDNVSLRLTSIDGANEANYAASALDADTFYAPQKFLAVMPKKLVIADEGYWISNKNSPYDNSGFVNRVVTVNLDGTESPKAVEVGVSFDLSISIDGTAPDCTIYY